MLSLMFLLQTQTVAENKAHNTETPSPDTTHTAFSQPTGTAAPGTPQTPASSHATIVKTPSPVTSPTASGNALLSEGAALDMTIVEMPTEQKSTPADTIMITATTPAPGFYVELIRDLGTQYLTKYPESVTNLRHTNQPVARKLQNYTPVAHATIDDHKQFLVNRYLELIDSKGEMASTIREFFKAQLSNEITGPYLVRNLSLASVKEIGQEYLDLFPEAKAGEPENRFSLFAPAHTNHELARTLVATQNQSAESLWNMLLDTYAQLPKPEGFIATRIERMICNTFTITFDKIDPAAWLSRNRSASDIADSVKAKIAEPLKTYCAPVVPVF